MNYMTQKIKDALKITAIYTLRQMLKVLWLFPIKKQRIVFNSFSGKQYSDNPKYIFLDLYKKYGSALEYIWCRNEKDDELLAYNNIKTMKFLSPAFLFSMITCGVYVTNCSVEPFIPKRKKQLYICSWHGGGAYKKLSHFYKNRKSFKIMSKTRAKMTTCYTSACKLFTEFIAPDWSADSAKFLSSGMPRNDILIHKKDDKKLVDSIKAKIGIGADKKVVLYAPTMRGWAVHPDSFDLTLDIESLLTALNERFGGDFVFVFRCHHVMLNRVKIHQHTIDVSSYNDMQELLLVSDVLITDYSSSIWDYSLLFRPCFLFTPDLSEYEAYQSFYVPISEWPVPYAQTNDELVSIIQSFDEHNYFEDVKQHHSELGSFETGTAVHAINEIIQKHMGAL